MAAPPSQMQAIQVLDPEFRDSYFSASGAKAALARDYDLDSDFHLPWFTEIPAEKNIEDRPLAETLLRRMDIALGILALAALSPFLLILSLLIKLESPGPVFFPQTRAGKDNRPFLMYKFRTMVHESSPRGLRLTSHDDARVTRIGGFLRRHHIDEVPQFWNVIIGDMSIVGPRPEIPSLAELNQANVPGYGERVAVRPGITGLAQITNGYSASLEEVHATAALDRHYIRHNCVLNYLRILLRTVPAVLFSKGAL